MTAEREETTQSGGSREPPSVELAANTYTTMGYMHDVAEAFRKVLSAGDEEATIRFFKEKLLESYRNGLAATRAAEQERTPRTGSGKPRRGRGARETGGR